MRVRFFLILLLGLVSVYISADNKTNVTTLYTTAKYKDVALPVMVDKTNINGTSFSNTNLLETFISLPQAKDFTNELKADIYDSFHLTKATGNARFYYLSFRMTADKYNKTNLRVKAPSMFDVYINGVKEGDKTTIEDSLSNAKTTKFNFSVLPSSTYNVVIKYMSLSSNKAPEDIVITLEPEDEKMDVKYSFSKLDKRRKITIQDILEYKRITSSAISPDGDFVLINYTTTKNDGKTYSENELLSLKDNQRLVLSPYVRYAWMPITNKLYYVDSRSGKNQLITVDPSTLREAILANDTPSGTFYFMPNEQQLIYLIEEKPKASPSDLVLLTAPESIQPRDGDRTFLAKYDLNTGVQQRLTFGKNSTNMGDISADSRYLLYSVTEYDATHRPFYFKSLYRLDFTTLAVDTLFTNEGFVNSANFSPDGTKILIKGSAEAFDGIGNNLPAGEIPNLYNKLAFVMDVATKQVEPISKDFSPSILQLYWDKVDGMIYLATTDKDYIKIYRYDPLKKKYSLLNLGEDVVQDFNLSSRSNKATYFGLSNSNFTRAYALDLKNDKSTLLADPDKQLVDHLNMNKVEDWSFVSSAGATIDGRYYLPPNFDLSKVVEVNSRN